MSTRLHTGAVFKMERPNSFVFSGSSSHFSRKLWNELPGYLRSIEDFDTFSS